MKYLWLGTAGVLFLGAPAWADDPPKKGDPPAAGQEKKADDESPQKQKYQKAQEAVNEARKEFQKVLTEQRAKKAEISLANEAIKAANDKQMEAQQAANAAGVDYVKSAPKAADAFGILQGVVFAGDASAGTLALLEEHYLSSDKLANVCRRLGYGRPTPDVEKFLRAVAEKNPKKDVQGAATLSLASLLLNAKKTAEAEKLLEKVVAEYGDVKGGRGTLGKEAEGQLFELRHLQVGKVAPDIEGEDVEGKKFKLSDYRGKVVMLDFWGHW